MITAFIIYLRAVGFYGLLTLPAMVLPPMYLISMMYVLVYGWFAWAFFTVIYMIIGSFSFDYKLKFIALFNAVVLAVTFAFQMIEELGGHEDVWNSGYLIFPFLAVIGGWVSVYMSRGKIRTNAWYKQPKKIVE